MLCAATTCFLLAAGAAGRVQPEKARGVLDRYLASAGEPEPEAERGFEIEASLPRLHKRGVMRGLRLFTGAGRAVYTQLHYAGDDVIRTAVIARFLSADTKAPSEDLALTTRNYRFDYQRTSDYSGRVAFVYRMTPFQRKVGLFRGELWLDAETARPLREWGQFVKSPSWMLSDIYFVRDYEARSADPQPRRLILKLHAAFAGPAELTMWLD